MRLGLAELDPYGAASTQGRLEDFAPRVGQVVELAKGQAGQCPERAGSEHLAHEGAVSPDDETAGYAVRSLAGRLVVSEEHPPGVRDHRVDELVGLLAATPREPLLRPATGGGARLHVPGADLRGDERVAGSQAH